MKGLATIRHWVRTNFFLRKLVGYHLASSGLFDTYFRNYKVSPYWEGRINTVLSSSDNDFIFREKYAGNISKGKQVLHNGLKVHLGSYYGPEYAKMLLLTKGVHEPQEERVFGAVLKTMPAEAVMIELGSFWSFYSMWFNKEVQHAVNYMVEPDAFNLGQGKRNFQLNKMQGNFLQAFIGKAATTDNKGKTVSVDSLIDLYKMEYIDILHSDIQGFEYEMLLGAEKALQNNKIGYVFISTHSNELHYQCIEKLKAYSFKILNSVDIDETFSEDGLIVAVSTAGNYNFPVIEVSKKIKKQQRY
jgi:hypothetical protein